MATSREPNAKCNIDIEWRCNATKIKKVEFKTLADFQYLPSELELSLISYVAYDDLSKEKLESLTRELNNKGWIEIVVGKHKSGYRGVGYFNTISGQLVIAHKGTTRTVNDWISDVLICFTSSNDQVSPAYDFTNEIIRNLGKKSTSIVITGHSLGGWLAQITGFLIQYPKCAQQVIGAGNMNRTAQSIQHIHVVAFDPPGAYGVISKYHKERYPEPETMLHNRLNYFDCVVYLCEVNPINTVVDKHVGFLFKMSGVMKHNMDFIIDFWKKDDKKLYVIRDWPCGITFCRKVELQEPDKSTIRISYFSPSEIDLLHDICIMAKKKNVQWRSVISDSVKGLGIDYQIFEGLTFGYLRLNIKVTYDLNYFIQTFKYIQNKIEIGKIFQDNQTVHEAIWLGYSESYVQSILKLEDEETSIPNTKQIEVLIEKQLKKLTKPKFYQIQSKSPTVSVSVIYNKFEQYRENVCFIDSKSLNAMAKYFPGVVKQSFPNGAVFIVQLNSEFKESDYLFRQDSNISIALITKSNYEKLSDKVFEFSPTLHFSNLLHKSKDQILAEIVLFQDTPMTIRSIVGSTGLDNIMLNDYNDLLECELPRIGNKLPSLDEFQRSYYIERKFYSNIVSNFDLNRIIGIGNHNLVKFCLLSRSRKFCDDKMDNEGELELLTSEEVKILQKILNLKESVNNNNSRTFNEEKQADLFLKIDSLNRCRNRKKQWHGADYVFKIKDLSTITITCQSQINQFWDSNNLIRDGLLQELDMGHGRPILIFENIGDLYCVNRHELVEVVEDPARIIHEEELHQNLLFGVRVIVGEPGMGKSTFLVNFIEKLRPIQKFVFYLNLNKCTNILSNLEHNFNIEWAELFCHMFEQNSDLINQTYVLLMKHALQNSVILMDGYDEISDRGQYQLNLFICYIRNFNPIIYIFSRLRERRKLETLFNVCAVRPVPLDKNEQIEFLRKFWSNKPEVKTIHHLHKDEIIERYSGQLVQKFTQSFPISESVIGIPLQLFMLGTVTLPKLITRFNKEESDDESLFLNVFQVIEEFIFVKYRIMFEEKERMDPSFSERNNFMYKTIVEKYNTIHSQLSFAYLFPNEFMEITGSKVDQGLTEDDLLTLQRIGIIYQVEWDHGSIKLEAIHRLILEYFSAQFIVYNLQNEKKAKQIEFLKTNFSKNSFDQIRLALDYLLSSASKTFRHIVLGNHILGQNRFEVRKILETSDTDLLGRNIMHYLISYAFETITVSETELIPECQLCPSTRELDSMNVSPPNYILFRLKKVEPKWKRRFLRCNYLKVVDFIHENNTDNIHHLKRGQEHSLCNSLFICNRLLMNDELDAGKMYSYASFYDFIDYSSCFKEYKYLDIPKQFLSCLETRIKQLPNSEYKEKCQKEFKKLVERLSPS